MGEGDLLRVPLLSCRTCSIRKLLGADDQNSVRPRPVRNTLAGMNDVTENATYVMLDTMVYLHYRSAEQLCLPEILTCQSVIIVVPRITVQELDAHKNTHQVAKIRERARQRLAAIKNWIQAGEVAPQISIQFEAARPRIDFAAHGLDPQWNDDQLLATVIQFHADHPGERLVLVTQDTGILLTAEHIGIEAIMVPEEKRLPEVEDPIAKENVQLRSELLRLKTAQPFLLIRFHGMADDIDHTMFELSEPAHVNIIDKEAFLQDVRQKFPEKHPGPPPGESRSPFATSAPAISFFGGPIPNSEYERYNRDREVYFSEVSVYLDRLAAYRTQPDRTLILELEMRNTGTVPAEDVDISIHFPNGFELYAEDDVPAAPEEPRPPVPPRNDLQRIGAAGLAGRLDMSAFSPRSSHMRPSDPFTLRKTNSYDLTDHVTRLKHGCAHQIRRLYVVFPSYKDAKSFNIDYRLAAANLPAPAVGKVHIVVEKA